MTSPKIKNNNVLGADIAPNAVTGSDVRNGSLTRDDFASNSLPQAPRARSRPGRPGRPRRSHRADHRPLAGRARRGGVAQNSAYSTQSVTVNCNANEKAISAGTGWSDDAAIASSGCSG